MSIAYLLGAVICRIKGSKGKPKHRWSRESVGGTKVCFRCGAISEVKRRKVTK